MKHIYLTFIYNSAIPPNIPMNDSNPGLCDTLSLNAIARSYPNSNCLGQTQRQIL
ncbi:hypothetical protein ACHAWT_008163, partial [Skeletonema menzelii]